MARFLVMQLQLLVLFCIILSHDEMGPSLDAFLIKENHFCIKKIVIFVHN